MGLRAGDGARMSYVYFKVRQKEMDILGKGCCSQGSSVVVWSGGRHPG